MNMVTVHEAIRLAVAAATGLSDTTPNPGFTIRRVEWKNRRTGARFGSTAGPATPGAAVWADLTLRSQHALGVDETRSEYDEDTDSIELNQTGSRLFTVSVRIESESQEPGEESVGYLAGRLRTRLRRRSVLDALRDAGVALVTIEPTAEADYKSGSSWISVSVTDVRFHVAENDVDTTYDGSYVGRVEGEGTLVRPDETELAVPLAVSGPGWEAPP